MFKHLLKKEAGFTLIEMLIVLLIISVLIILIVPNLSNSTKDINEKGCDALEKVAQTQVNLYHLDHKKYPKSLAELVEKRYLSDDQTSCSNGQSLNYDESSGIVTKPSP